MSDTPQAQCFADHMKRAIIQFVSEQFQPRSSESIHIGIGIGNTQIEDVMWGIGQH